MSLLLLRVKWLISGENGVQKHICLSLLKYSSVPLADTCVHHSATAGTLIGYHTPKIGRVHLSSLQCRRIIELVLSLTASCWQGCSWGDLAASCFGVHREFFDLVCDKFLDLLFSNHNVGPLEPGLIGLVLFLILYHILVHRVVLIVVILLLAGAVEQATLLKVLLPRPIGLPLD